MNRFFFLIITLFFFASCKKTKDPTVPASVLIVQANPDVSSVIPVIGNVTPHYFSSSVSIGYGGFNLYDPSGGTQALTIYQYPDTVKPIFQTSLNLESSGIYSFFLAGNAGKEDTVLIKENITNYSNGSVGVRFINLSPDSHSLSVNFDITPGEAEFNNLNYKQAAGFKVYPQNPDGYYNFEVHDQSTGDLLGTYTWYYKAGKNSTIVISGSVDPSSSTPLTIFQVDHTWQ